MRDYTNLFSPQTYQAFLQSERNISGFRVTQKERVKSLKVGDRLFCYVTEISRWFGVLEVTGTWFEDDTAIFMTPDIFTQRVRVRCLILHDVDGAVPIKSKELWDRLSFTKDCPVSSPRWTGILRSSLNLIRDLDSNLLMEVLGKKKEQKPLFKLSPRHERIFRDNFVKPDESSLVVAIPDADEKKDSEPQARESYHFQTIVAKIGARMKYDIWIPPADRQAILRLAPELANHFTESLPFNFDEALIRTVRNIDVLWISQYAIRRAFEIEHTTEIYSGILRMADLFRLMPNLEIEFYIVAPASRNEKFMREIHRPVFAMLDKKGLPGRCSFLSYENLKLLAADKNLAYLSDSVLEQYAERASTQLP